MPIMLTVFSQNTWRDIRELSPEEFADFERHITYLTEFAQAMDLFVMVGDNLREYRMFIQTNLQAFASSRKADRSGTFIMLRNVNRLLLNFLIMTTTCLDQTATMLSRQFGANSVELAAFNRGSFG
jgi:hypothetical protein